MPTLKRITDGAGDQGARSEALKINKEGKLEIISNRPILGCAMLVGSVTARSYQHQDYWLTTYITEIIEEKEDYVKFRTGNSIYEWWA